MSLVPRTRLTSACSSSLIASVTISMVSSKNSKPRMVLFPTMKRYSMNEGKFGRVSHGITCLCSWKSNYRRAVNRPRRQAVNRQSQRAPHPPEVLQFSTLRRKPALPRVLRLLQLLLPRRNRANSKNKAFHVSSASFFLVSCRNLTSRMSVWPDFFG